MSQIREDWEIRSFEVFANQIVGHIEEYYEIVATSDLVISQPIHNGYRDRDDLSLSFIRKSVKPGARVIVFPSMHFEGQLIDCRSLPIRAHGMDYHNILLVHLTASGLPLSEILQIVADPHLYPPSFIASERERSISEMRRREIDDAVDVGLSLFLEAFAHRTQIFHTINHPCRPALIWMTRRILERLGQTPRVDVPPIRGPWPIPSPHIPLPPPVARALPPADPALKDWIVEDGHLYHYEDKKVSPDSYYSDAITDLRCHSSESLVGFLCEPPAKSFLGRLARVRPDIPGIGFWNRSI